MHALAMRVCRLLNRRNAEVREGRSSHRNVRATIDDALVTIARCGPDKQQALEG
jgi:hypothetical protein